MALKTNKFGAIVPKYITKSFSHFAQEEDYSDLLTTMLLIGWKYIDKNIKEVKEFISNVHHEPTNEVSSELVKDILSGKEDKSFKIETYELFYCQMLYSRLVDNIIAYLKEILGEVILSNPEILKSGEVERRDFILSFDTLVELKIAISEKTIESLFYSGIEKIESFFKDRLGLSIFKTTEIKNDFDIAVKKRNLIVHNRGKINKTFIKEFPNSKYNENDLINVTFDEISNSNLKFHNFITILDSEIANKFNLQLITNR